MTVISVVDVGDLGCVWSSSMHADWLFTCKLQRWIWVVERGSDETGSHDFVVLGILEDSA